MPGAPSRSSLGLTSSSVESPTNFAPWKLESSQREMHRDSRVGITFLFASLARWSRFALLSCGLAFGALDAHDNLQLVITSCEHHLTDLPLCLPRYEVYVHGLHMLDRQTETSTRLIHLCASGLPPRRSQDFPFACSVAISSALHTISNRLARSHTDDPSPAGLSSRS